MALGLGYASALLQAQLGVGAAAAAAAVGERSSADFRKALGGASCDAVIAAAARATAPAALLAAVGLGQARVGQPDPLASLGLMVSSAALAAGTAVALAQAVLMEGCADEDQLGKARPLVRAERLVLSMRAYGQAMLVFTALPAGLQLMCASLVLRVALALRAAVDVTRALRLRRSSAVAALEEAEGTVALAPVLGGLALLDHMAWGSCAAFLAPLQPAIYLVFQAMLSSGGFGDGAQVQAARSWSSAALYIAAAFASARVLVGTFSVEVSASRLGVQWGEPLLAAAAILAALTCGVHLIAFGAGSGAAASGMERVPSNGEQAGAEADEAFRPMEVGRAIVAPAGGLLLGLLAAFLGSEEDTSFIALPAKNGFVLAVIALWAQVTLLFMHPALNVGSEVGVETDPAGTVDLKPASPATRRIMDNVRLGILMLLEGGLVLGCLGLGVPVFVTGGLGAILSMYMVASAEGRERAHRIGTVVASGMMSSLGDFFEQRRLAAEEAAARRAAAAAEALEQAEIKKGGASASGSKAAAEKTTKPQTGTVGAAAKAGPKKDAPKKKK